VGIVTAFGLGGCNAAAVFQPRITSVNPTRPDSKHKGLHTDMWVQVEGASPRATTATSGGRMIFCLQHGASSMQVRLSRDGIGVHILKYIAHQRLKNPIIVQYSGRQHNEIACTHLVKAASMFVVLSAFVSPSKSIPLRTLLLPSTITSAVCDDTQSCKTLFLLV